MVPFVMVDYELFLSYKWDTRNMSQAFEWRSFFLHSLVSLGLPPKDPPVIRLIEGSAKLIIDVFSAGLFSLS